MVSYFAGTAYRTMVLWLSAKTRAAPYAQRPQGSRKPRLWRIAHRGNIWMPPDLLTYANERTDLSGIN